MTEVDGRKLTVDFWDTAGQERFASLHSSYYHRAHACILVFDISRKVTYTNLTTWYDELQQHRRGIPILVVANKIDMNPKAASKPFLFTEKRGLPKTRFCSASDGTNVVALFQDIVRLAAQRKYDSAIGKGLVAGLAGLDDAAVVRESADAGAGAGTGVGLGGDGDDYVDEVMAALEYFELKEDKDKDKDKAGP